MISHLNFVFILFLDCLTLGLQLTSVVAGGRSELKTATSGRWLAMALFVSWVTGGRKELEVAMASGELFVTTSCES